MTPTAEVPNPIGVHALVWVGDTCPASVESAISQTVAAGYDMLEFSLHDSVSIDRAKTRELLTANGITAACSRGLARDADVSSDDPAVVERGAALLAESLAVTHDIGATILTGALYSAFGKYPHALTHRRVGPTSSRCCATLPRKPRHSGVTLGLEICNRYETNVVNTARDCLRLADDIGADNVVIHLDTYHMNIEEDDFVTPVRDCGDRLGYVHIGENHRGYLGSGHIDFAAFFGALAEIDYRGPLTFESFSSAVVAPGLSNDLAIWRNLWDDGVDLAPHARRFISDGLRDSPPARRVAGMIGVAAESDTLERLAEDAIALADNRQRAVLGIAGSPGAGKSTLVEQLLARIGERKGIGWVAHVPMDGFHLADEQLAASVPSDERVRQTPSIRWATRTSSSGSPRKPTHRCTRRASTAHSNSHSRRRWWCCRPPGW